MILKIFILFLLGLLPLLFFKERQQKERYLLMYMTLFVLLTINYLR